MGSGDRQGTVLLATQNEGGGHTFLEGSSTALALEAIPPSTYCCAKNWSQTQGERTGGTSTKEGTGAHMDVTVAAPHTTHVTALLLFGCNHATCTQHTIAHIIT